MQDGRAEAAPRGVITRSRSRRASRRIRPTPTGGKGKARGLKRSVHGNTVTVMQSTESSLKHVLLMHMDSVADGLVGPRGRPYLNRTLRTKLRGLIHRYYGKVDLIRRFSARSWKEEEEEDEEEGEEDPDDETTESEPQAEAALPERSQSEASHVEFEIKLKV